MSEKVPERIRWAMELLAIDPGDEVLEVGCGTGVAVGLVCARLGNGHLTAIDRSAAMAAKARARNDACLRAGKVEILCAALSDFSGSPGRFDRVFAINVNVFWQRPEAELAVLRRVLKPGGTIHLIFQPPSETKVEAIASSCQRHLLAHGFTDIGSARRRMSPVSGVCVHAVRGPDHAMKQP